MQRSSRLMHGQARVKVIRWMNFCSNATPPSPRAEQRAGLSGSGIRRGCKCARKFRSVTNPCSQKPGRGFKRHNLPAQIIRRACVTCGWDVLVL